MCSQTIIDEAKSRGLTRARDETCPLVSKVALQEAIVAEAGR